MRESLIGTTYDLLTFFGQGNDSLFDRCFRKTTKYFSLEWETDTYRKNRNIAFHYLRSTGYLDYLSQGSLWVVSPPALVQRAPTDFVLVGGTQLVKKLREMAPVELLSELHNRSSLDVSDSLSFFPQIVHLRATNKEATRLASLLGIHICADYQNQLFCKLPTLKSVLETILVSATSGAVFEPNTAQHFSDEHKQWVPFADMRPHEPGLYRRDSQYAAPVYYLASSRRNRPIEVWTINDREWAAICYLAQFSKHLVLKYRRTDGALFVPRNEFQEIRMPTLLQRCFRSGSLLNPAVDQTHLIYSNVSERNLFRLISKLNVFSMEWL